MSHAHARQQPTRQPHVSCACQSTAPDVPNKHTLSRSHAHAPQNCSVPYPRWCTRPATELLRAGATMRPKRARADSRRGYMTKLPHPADARRAKARFPAAALPPQAPCPSLPATRPYPFRRRCCSGAGDVPLPRIKLVATPRQPGAHWGCQSSDQHAIPQVVPLLSTAGPSCPSERLPPPLCAPTAGLHSIRPRAERNPCPPHSSVLPPAYAASSLRPPRLPRRCCCSSSATRLLRPLPPTARPPFTLQAISSWPFRRPACRRRSPGCAPGRRSPARCSRR